MTILRKFVFGTVWFVLFYFGSCAAIGAFIGAVAGGNDPQHAAEAASIASRQFIGEHVLHILAGSFLLALAGAATGRLPGTRRSVPSVLAEDPGQWAMTPVVFPKPFGIREGLAALLWVGAAQLFAFFMVGVVAGLDVGSSGSAALNLRVVELLPYGLLLAYSISAVVLFLLFRGYARRADWPTINDSFGLAWGKASANSLGLLCGIVLAASYLLLAPLIADPEVAGPSTMAKMAQSPDGRIAFAAAAVLLAPPTEELFFRSLLIRSLESRLSLPVAAFVSAALFWLLHVPEAQSYWPAEISIGLLAGLVTYLRISNRALGPAIFGHAGYNLTIAASTFLAGGGS